MSMPERRMVRLEDVIRVIFQEFDPVQLKAMWDEDDEIKKIACLRLSVCFI
jgi:hypothetical protein